MRPILPCEGLLLPSEGLLLPTRPGTMPLFFGMFEPVRLWLDVLACEPIGRWLELML